MTSGARSLRFQVLGPLEVLTETGRAVPVGGAKQRAVLALLLLRSDEIVSLEQLIDELWGENPPRSAPHTLEAYVSRLRGLFAGHDTSIVRRGVGYSLELGDAVLDERVFTALLEEASGAGAAGDHERTAELAAEALGVWRGPALADVPLGPIGSAEAQRLEELRLRALEQQMTAELALGRNEELVGKLRLLVAENPYRERFIAQLMLALYRSGRHADAVAVYESTRGAMDAELGLRPSAELQQLSGQIVRHEPALTQMPRDSTTTPASRPGTRTSKGTVAGLAFVAAAAAATMAFALVGGAPSAAGSKPAPGSVALVLPRAASPSRPGDVVRFYVQSLKGAAGRRRLTTETMVADEIEPRASDVATVVSKLRGGHFDLVLWIGDGAAARAAAPLVRELSGTRFVFLDASLGTLRLTGVPNASAVSFADEQASELVGYLAGLTPDRGSKSRHADVVSVVAGLPTAHTRSAIAGFRRGIKRALPGVRVLVDYSRELADRTSCERLANSQIDAGSDVVFATAGDCGLGALAVAVTRGVWGLGDDELERGPTRLRSRALAHTYKENEAAVGAAVDAFANGTLPAGENSTLGLDDDYAVGIWDINDEVTSSVRSRVVRLCSSIRSAHPRAS